MANRSAIKKVHERISRRRELQEKLKRHVSEYGTNNQSSNVIGQDANHSSDNTQIITTDQNNNKHEINFHKCYNTPDVTIDEFGTFCELMDVIEYNSIYDLNFFNQFFNFLEEL